MTVRKTKKTDVGVVTSDKMQKTIIVRVERRVRHPKFGKFITKYTTYKAHDEKEQAATGDLVEIAETRPMSKTKKFRLVKIVKKYEPLEEQAAALISQEAVLPKTETSSQGESGL